MQISWLPSLVCSWNPHDGLGVPASLGEVAWQDFALQRYTVEIEKEEKKKDSETATLFPRRFHVYVAEIVRQWHRLSDLYLRIFSLIAWKSHNHNRVPPEKLWAWQFPTRHVSLGSSCFMEWSSAFLQSLLFVAIARIPACRTSLVRCCRRPKLQQILICLDLEPATKCLFEILILAPCNLQSVVLKSQTPAV